jgi:L-fuconolactonase
MKMAVQAENPPIIDTHLHLWDLTRLRLPWIARGDAFDRNYTMDDYRQAIHGLNVVKAVYMEVDVADEHKRAEADFVLDLCRQGNTPMVGAVIGGRPASDGFRAYLEPLRNNRFLKGVRQVLHTDGTPPGTGTQEAFLRGVRLLGEWGLRFDLCMRPTDLGDALRIIESCPDTRFVLDHCGNGPIYAENRDQWRKGIDRLARIERVMCKISGIVVQARQGWRADNLAPVINHCLASFGPDRVMFAGDWPVCTRAATFRQWVEALQSIVRERPLEERRKLFHDNAARFYGI